MRLRRIFGPVALSWLFLAHDCLAIGRFQETVPAGNNEAEEIFLKLTDEEALLRQAPDQWPKSRLAGLKESAESGIAKANAAQRQNIRNILGVIYMGAGEYADAARVFQDIEFSSEMPEADRGVYRYNLGRALERTGEREKALESYRLSIRESAFNPAYTAGIRVLKETGKLNSASAAAICTLMLDGGFKQSADACFQDQLDAWKDAADSKDLLGYVIRRYSDPLESPDGLSQRICRNAPQTRCLDLDELQARGFAAAANIRLVVTGNFPVAFNSDSVKGILSGWPEDPDAGFSKLLAVSGARLKERRGFAEAALASNAAAWVLDSSNLDAARRSAELLGELGRSDRKRDLIGQFVKAVQPVRVVSSPEEWPAVAALDTAIGDALISIRPCRPSATPELDDPFYYWMAALTSEARSSGRTIRGAIPDSEELLNIDSISPLLSRRLADCYKPYRHQPGMNDLYLAFERKAIAPETKSMSAGARLRFHVKSMYYPGGLFKSSLQAAIAQATDSPTGWGQGWGAYGKRLASSHGTRAIRKTMELGLDSLLHQDPRYFPASHPGTRARLWNVIKQTFVSPDRHFSNRFAAWRFGSAIGSELVSNLWRPAGSSWGDASIRAAVYRGGFVIAGDTLSNGLREFLPYRGTIGRLLRPLLNR